MWQPPTGHPMNSPTPALAPRRLLVLCGLVPLPEMTQAEVDFLFRHLVEDAPASDEVEESVSQPAD